MISSSGTSSGNLDNIERFFFRGLRICMGNDIVYTKDELCLECRVSTLSKRRDLHLLLFMHEQSSDQDLLKPRRANTIDYIRFFLRYKPSNEKVRLNVLYGGSLLWNDLPAERRNMFFLIF